MSVAVLAWVPAVPAAAGVVLSPGDDIQAAVDAAPEGEIFTLRPGVDGHQMIRLKDRQQLLGQPGVVLSGAMILRERHREADLWVVGGLPDPRRPEGRCRAETDLCRYREDLFVDRYALPESRVAGGARTGPSAAGRTSGREAWRDTGPSSWSNAGP